MPKAQRTKELSCFAFLNVLTQSINNSKFNFVWFGILVWKTEKIRVNIGVFNNDNIYNFESVQGENLLHTAETKSNLD